MVCPRRGAFGYRMCRGSFLTFIFVAACGLLVRSVNIDESTDEGAAEDGKNSLDEELRLPRLYPRYETPPYFDYDCDLVRTKTSAKNNWDEVYAYVNKSVQWSKTNFNFPRQFHHLVRAYGPHVEECPLGVLYLRILYWYDRVSDIGSITEELEEESSFNQMLLRSFPLFALALSRWPIFYALHTLGSRHEEDPNHSCDGKHGVLDWGALRQKGVKWIQAKMDPLFDEDTTGIEVSLGQDFLHILSKKERQDKAQNECEFGFYFLVASQVVAAADRETQHMRPFNFILDVFMSSVPLARFAESGWPILGILGIFGDLNKAQWFFGGDRKYYRGYSDWNLRRDELSPLVHSSLEFLSPPWCQEAGRITEALSAMPSDAYRREVLRLVQRREELDGEPLRPIVRQIVDAALTVASAPWAPHERRLAYVVLLYGKKWSVILRRMVRRMRQLRIKTPLVVIAIGDEAARACRDLANGRRADSSPEHLPPATVACWNPLSESQVHRFTAILSLLHLGIDILYMDMDTYLIRDPAPRVLLQVEAGNGSGPMEALFARHADADCVNIGVFYLRATANVSVWMAQYVSWYHDHPFEIDQRGMHVFLGLPTEQMGVAYCPMHLPKLRAGILEDVNEIVIGDVGWHGELSNMLIFHWCHRPIELKEMELNMAYNAGDAIEPYNIPLSVILNSVTEAPDDEDHPLHQVFAFRQVLESYRKSEPPNRTFCW